MKYGYKPSGGNFGSVNVQPFVQSPALQKVAAQNTSNTHIIESGLVPTKNQGQISGCASFSTTTALEILNALSTHAFEPLSPYFVYYNARVMDNDVGSDAGSYIHNNFSSLQSIGTCGLAMWKSDPKRIFDTPSILAYKEANDNTISTFRNISSSGSDRLGDVEAAIRANLPVVWGTAVGQDFEDYSGSNNVVFNPPSDKDVKGMHATTLVGVRQDGSDRDYLLLNSWDSSWGLTENGKGGFCWVSSDYLLNHNSSDFFVAESMTSLLV